VPISNKKEQRDYVEPTAQGEILREYPMLVGHNSDSTLYNWKIKNYKAHAKKNWSIEIIPKNPKTFYSIHAVPIVYEKKIRQNPILIPTGSRISNPLQYNE
jgi:hypothetical protein